MQSQMLDEISDQIDQNQKSEVLEVNNANDEPRLEISGMDCTDTVKKSEIHFGNLKTELEKLEHGIEAIKKELSSRDKFIRHSKEEFL